jgi:hypothetical protein
MSPSAAELQDLHRNDVVDFICFDTENATPEIVSTRIERIVELTGRLVIQGYQTNEDTQTARVMVLLSTDHELSPSGELEVTQQDITD